MSTLAYIPLIRERSAHYGVNPALVEAIMNRESGGVPTARGAGGEYGLMQLHPNGAIKAWESAGKPRVNYMDPWHNVNIACWFLAGLQTDLRSRGLPVEVRQLVIAYNAGMSYNVNGRTLPPVTQSYLRYVDERLRSGAWLRLQAHADASSPLAGLSVPAVTLGTVRPDATAAPAPVGPLAEAPADVMNRGKAAAPDWSKLGLAAVVGLALLAALRSVRELLPRF